MRGRDHMLFARAGLRRDYWKSHMAERVSTRLEENARDKYPMVLSLVRRKDVKGLTDRV